MLLDVVRYGSSLLVVVCNAGVVFFVFGLLFGVVRCWLLIVCWLSLLVLWLSVDVCCCL